MATLTQILHKRSRATVNLEKGQIYVWTPGSMFTEFQPGNCSTWVAPTNGTAVIELWGASGSGSRGACCGYGVPGNPGAYVKKTLNVNAGDWVRGIVGLSCGNASTTCFRGCSQSSCMTICRVGICCFCLCAEGGRGGNTWCSTGTGGFCCFGRSSWLAAECFKTRGHPGDCGLICNWCSGWCSFGRGFGGDINCCGGVSCTSFIGTSGSRSCCYIYHTAISPGIISEDGAVLSWMSNCDSGINAATGSGAWETLYSLGLATKRPNNMHVPSGCWMGNKHCGCYESHGCSRYMPPGVPGAPFMNGDSNVCGHGIGGGHGMMRIKFIGNT